MIHVSYSTQPLELLEILETPPQQHHSSKEGEWWVEVLFIYLAMKLGRCCSSVIISDLWLFAEIAVQSWFWNSAAQVCFGCERPRCCICWCEQLGNLWPWHIWWLWSQCGREPCRLGSWLWKISGRNLFRIIYIYIKYKFRQTLV